MKSKIKKLTIQLVETELFTQQVNAIVLPTEPMLTLPAEVLEKGGSQLADAIMLQGWCDVGRAVSLDAGELNLDTLLLAVPPKWGEASARGKLANTIWDILQLAESLGIKKLAMPPIGVGKFGHPVEATAHIMIEQMLDFAYEPLKHLRSILICVSTDVAYTAFKHELTQQTLSINSSEDTQAGVG